jgi:hypothetical protein
MKIGPKFRENLRKLFSNSGEGARGSVVVKELGYKPEGRGFENR